MVRSDGRGGVEFPLHDWYNFGMKKTMLCAVAYAMVVASFAQSSVKSMPTGREWEDHTLLHYGIGVAVLKTDP